MWLLFIRTLRGSRARVTPRCAVASLALTTSLVACGAESLGKAASPVRTASTPEPSPSPRRTGDSFSIASAIKHPADSVAARTDTAAPPTATASVTSLSRRALVLPLLPSRTRRDTISYVHTIRLGEKGLWPSTPASRPGSVLPGKRIVAFYGNPLSKRMGVLGEYPVEEMLARLDTAVKAWQTADPSTPVQPALHLIAVVAQGSPGRDGMYRLRMPDSLIETVYQWAKQRNALLFLDIQVGASTLPAELPRLLRFLERPDVHLGIDPEFSMHYEKEGLKPGTKIGTMMASDVNYAVRTLADFVAARNLPPKVLVVHRFTRRMVPNPRQIQLDPHVQVVMDMDGWGPPWLKFDSYRDYIVAEPVQFTGFKIFFHNDAKTGEAILTPAELLRLVPKPLYIQYQ